MVKCLPEFEYFYCFLKNKNIIFKIRRSKVSVTDYAALMKTFEMREKMQNNKGTYLQSCSYHSLAPNIY